MILDNSNGVPELLAEKMYTGELSVINTALFQQLENLSK